MTRLIAVSALQVALAIALVGIALLVAGAQRNHAQLIHAGYGAVYTIA